MTELERQINEGITHNIVGFEPSGALIFEDIDTKKRFVSGETLEDYGREFLYDFEREKLLLPAKISL